MGRGGGGRGRGGGYGGDKVEALFQAIQNEKIDTVRWSFVNGGIPLSASDEYGQTPLMVAAAGGKVNSLDIILQQVRRLRSAKDRSEILDAADGEGSTALMMAAVRNRFECVKMLKAGGAWLNMKDADGYTARARADYAGNKKIVELLDGLRTEEEDSEPDSAEDSEGGFEGETSTQRSKRKKREKEGGNALTCSAKREKEKKEKAEAEAEEAKAAAKAQESADKTEPVLAEVSEALAAAAEEEKRSGALKDLTVSLVRTEESQAAGLTAGQIDPALWRCGQSLRHLVIRWRPGLVAGSLDRVGACRRILHLIVQDSALPALPDALGDLKELRSLEVDGNELKDFPSSIGSLAGSLESISAARNKLKAASLGKLAGLNNLKSLKLDKNHLVDLDDLDLAQKGHLVTLSVAGNKIAELPDDPWEKLVMLQHLNVSGNDLKELPCEMGAMKEKKLTELLLDENPWKDGKIRNMIENSAVLSQTVLTYLRKLKPKGKKKAKPKRKAKAASESEEDSDAPAEAAAKDESSDSDAPAPAPAAPPPSSKKKKGKNKSKAAKESDSD